MSYNNKPHYQNKKPDVSHMVLPLTAQQIADAAFMMERLTVGQRRELISYGHQLMNSSSQDQRQGPPQQQSNFQSSAPSNRGRFSNNPNYHHSNNNANDDSEQQQPSYTGKKKYLPKSQQRTPYKKNFEGKKNFKNNQSNDQSNDQSNNQTNDQSNEGQDDQEYEYEQEAEQETPATATSKNTDWSEATDNDDIPEMPKKTTFNKKQGNGENPVKFKRREAPQPKEVVQQEPKENLSM